MKIQKIHILNLASIVDATIDFTTAPLDNADIFAITGETGTGKTTILDAICLALYNTTPRFASASGSQGVNDNGDQFSPRDPRQLMRRNTGEATVELEFEGNNHVHYLATWHVQRGKSKKIHQKLDDVTWSLRNLSTGVDVAKCQGKSASKTKEVKDAILEAVGLDFNQFCRTTMLAQGEFTRFLESSEDEKAAILEKLTQFSDFSRAGQTIFEITTEKKKAFEDAQEKASDVGLRDEELLAKRQERDALAAENATQNALRSRANAKRAWLQQNEAAVAALEKAQTELEAAEAKKADPEFQQSAQLLKDWDSTADVRAQLADRNAAQAQIVRSQSELEQRKDDFRALQAELRDEKAALDSLRREAAETDDLLRREEPQAPVYEKVQELHAAVSSRKTELAEIEAHEKKLAEAQKKHDGPLTLAAQNAAKDSEAASVLLAQGEADLRQKELDVAALHVEEIHNEHQRVLNAQKSLDAAKANLEAMREAAAKHQAEEKRLDGVQRDIEEKERRLQNDVRPRRERAELAMQEREADANKAHDTVDTFAKHMRAKLTPGCTCPVCRQTVAALPAMEDELDRLYAQAQKAWTDAQSEFKAAKKDEEVLAQEIAAAEKRLAADKDRLFRDHSVEQAQGKVLASSLASGMKLADISEATDDAFAKHGEALRKQLETEILPRLQEAATAESDVAALRAKTQALREDAERKRKAKDAADAALASCANDIENLGIRRDEAHADAQRYEATIDAILSSMPWKDTWRNDAEATLHEIETRAADYHAAQDRARDLANRISTAEDVCRDVEDVVGKLHARHSEWAGVGAAEGDVNHIANLRRFAQDLFAKVSESLRLMEQAETTRRDAVAKLDAYFADHPEMNEARIVLLIEEQSNISTMRAQEQHVLGEIDRARGARDSAQKACAEQRHQRPEDLGPEDNVANLQRQIQETEATINENAQRLGALNAELEADARKKNALGALREIAEKANAEYQRWDRLCKIFGDKEGRTFRLIAQSYILAGLLEAANKHLQKLDPRYELRAVPGELHILIVDAEQAYATRGTDTLSGGEKFLVSLSLALALAEIGHTLSVDTLFIDEGFGTLDQKFLFYCLELLRSLNKSSKRHVGVISHIPEISESIPVQIQLKRSVDNSSSSVHVVEVGNA